VSNEAAITINGQQLSDDESAIMRMAVEAFTTVMAQGIEDNDEASPVHLLSPIYQP
jgi:hypothetical protein